MAKRNGNDMRATTTTSFGKTPTMAASPSRGPGGAAPGVVNLSYQQVAAKAYEIYCNRIRTGARGDAHSDWVAAEAALRAAARR
ncbi:MAG: hypothetical protein PHU85_14360 [Phycisphaerae bacterium]|nr:hypothetical protein [Phycisphaerae bacterium]